MEIKIVTNGDCADTEISINGNPIKTLKEFNLSVQVGRKVKLQMVKEVNGQNEFLSYYGGDFAKFDEYNSIKNLNKKGELENGKQNNS